MDPSQVPVLSALAGPSPPYFSVVPIPQVPGLPFGLMVAPSPLMSFGGQMPFPFGGFPFGTMPIPLGFGAAGQPENTLNYVPTPKPPTRPPPGFGGEALNQGHVSEHGRVVEDSRIHRCWCGKRFATSTLLRQHGFKHASGFGCDYCPKTFRTLDSMKQHRNDSHASLLNAERCTPKRRAGNGPVSKQTTPSKPKNVAANWDSATDGPVSAKASAGVPQTPAEFVLPAPSVDETGRRPLYSRVVRGQYKCIFDGLCFPSAKDLSVHLSICPSFKVL